MTRRRTGRAILLVLAVLAAACTGDSSDEPADDAERPAGPAPAVEAWSLDVDPIGPPVLVEDGVAVVIEAADDEEMALVGVDVATGEELWTTPTSPGQGPRTHPVTPLVVTGPDGQRALVHARWTPNGANELDSRVVRLDPRTGEELWATAPLPLTVGPEPCPDQAPGGVCVTAEDETGGGTVRWRIDLADGRVGVVAEPEGFVLERSFGAGLVDLRVGRDHHVGLVRDGRLVWATPVDEAFGPRRSPDFGWMWVHHAEAGVFVGSVGSSALPDRPIDLSDNRIVALDEATGQILWTDEAASIRCVERLALPGPWPPARGDETTAPPLRCRTEGTLPAPEDLDEEDPLPEVLVTVEGYDPATGETTWSLDLGDEPGAVLIRDEVDTRRVGATGAADTVVLPADGTPTVVDLGDGTTSEVLPGAVLACSGPTVPFTHPAPWVDSFGAARGDPAEGDDERIGGELVVPCGPDLEPVDAGLPPEAVAAVGVEAGDVTLVALEGRLVGYETP